MGKAAGIAISVAKNTNKNTHSLSIEQFQTLLKENGANL